MKRSTAALILTLALITTAAQAQGASLSNGDLKSQKRIAATFHYGLMSNSSSQDLGADAGLLRYMAAGFTVSTNLAHRILLNGPVDSLRLEGGAFFYRVADLIPDGGGSIVLPLRGTASYGVHLSSRVEVAAYLGVLKNLAFGGTSATRQQLDRTLVATGVTASVGISDWLAARADAGTDLIGLGLTVIF